MGHRMRMLLRCRGLHPLIGKFFFRGLTGDLNNFFFFVNRSRSWVAEEGEVFRKGTVLLGPAEMEGEYAGEELRKEVRLKILKNSRESHRSELVLC
jgi:hypothetical protein